MQKDMRINSKVSSIEFFVDEEADSLLAFERSSLREGEPPEVQEILRLPLGNIRTREPAEIQRTLGRLVLSFLNSRSAKGLNLPRDLEDEKRLDEEHFDKLRAAAGAKEPMAVYDLAVSLIGRGMSKENWADIEQGEELLNQAIKAGLPAAIQYEAEVWTLLRPRLEHKMKHSRGQ